ncbi:MAG: TIGR00341 family protein [Proteobacteria bacterium]|nr:TIGR00341 family protein [Pseudomonadota bacterium]
MVLKEENGAEVRELLREHTVLEHRQIRLPDGEVLIRILLDAEQIEAVLDLLGNRYTNEEGYRAVILPVEATLPRARADIDATRGQARTEEKSPERIGREELYEDIKEAAHCSRVYLVMVVLSTIVAAIGLYDNSVAIVIGAMVIAPLLGPNMAMALATTLGDLPLLWRALKTSVTGIGTAMALSVVLGVMLQVNPASPEIATRAGLALGDLVVALASGAAGALAFTTGVSTTLIGVMVAVALLPPLVTSGLLLGGGHVVLAMDALSLLLMNVICVNLAGVATFLAQGIRPATWWEKNRAVKASRIALVLWAALLAGLIGLILLLRKT